MHMKVLLLFTWTQTVQHNGEQYVLKGRGSWEKQYTINLPINYMLKYARLYVRLIIHYINAISFTDE